MGTITATELLQRWSRDDMPVEMAVGHLLQHLVILHETDQKAATSRTQLAKRIDSLDETAIRLQTALEKSSVSITHLHEAIKALSLNQTQHQTNFTSSQKTVRALQADLGRVLGALDMTATDPELLPVKRRRGRPRKNK